MEDMSMSDSQSSSPSHSSTANLSEASDALQCHRFLGCYLLVSRSTEPRSANRTYIGFTIDPPRRLKQHNGKLKYGGAKRTKRHRPWDMVAVVHGFASNTQALQFEWAWQNPFKSVALKIHFDRPDAMTLPSMRRKSVNGCLQTLAAMVSVPPWCLCPLTLTICAPREQWDEFQIQCVVFPKHFRVNFSPLTSFSDCLLSYAYRHRCDSVMPRQLPGSDGGCLVCKEPVQSGTSDGSTTRRITHCAHCGVKSHLACMASCRDKDDFVSPNSLLPNKVRCRFCQGQMHWSLIVRLARALASDDD